MFKLTENELQLAFNAIEHHGYSTLIPQPKEWQIVKENWEKFRLELSTEDLDIYKPYTPMRIFAPKSRYSLRAVTLLHPQDLIIYTALTLIFKNDIEKARIPKSARRVYSFRSNPTIKDQLYQSDEMYQKYLNELKTKSSQKKNDFVAVTDIADFYPRIYLHRLENAILSITDDERSKRAAQILINKILPTFGRGTSYGLPIGPYASRILAEAVLIDVDAALLHANLNFVRWVDDYTFFCKNWDEARYSLFFIAEWLYNQHGLTLQSTKTKILTKEGFQKKLLEGPHERVKSGNEKLYHIWQSANEYEENGDEPKSLSDDDIEYISTINLANMLEEALKNKNIELVR